MPYANKEKKREYNKRYYREKVKPKLEEQKRKKEEKWDYKPLREEFLTWQQWKLENPNGSFKDYLAEKIEFEKELALRNKLWREHDKAWSNIEEKEPIHGRYCACEECCEWRKKHRKIKGVKLW